MAEYKLNELIFTLAVVSLVSWSVVAITAVLRIGAQLRYRRLARVQMRQQIQEGMEQ